jgi:hypothetical protein
MTPPSARAKQIAEAVWRDYIAYGGPWPDLVARALDAETGRCIKILEGVLNRENILGQSLCEFCGDENTLWPNHRPDCEFGQVLRTLADEEA